MNLIDVLSILITGWFIGVITLAGGFVFLVKFGERTNHPTADGRYLSVDEMAEEAFNEPIPTY